MNRIFKTLTLVCMMLFLGIDCWSAPSINDILGPYLLYADLGTTGKMNDVDCKISEGNANDRVNIEFKISVPVLGNTVIADVKASAHYADGTMTLYGNELALANSSVQGITISLGHRPSAGKEPEAADAISAEWRDGNFFFDPNDCILLNYSLYRVVASELTLKRIDEEKPTCKFVGSLPSNGSVVKSLSEITTYWNRIDERVIVQNVSVRLYNDKDGSYTTGRITNTSDTTCVVTFDPVITDPGNYRLVIPDGFVKSKSGDSLNSEITLYFYIADSNFIPNIEAIVDDYSLSFAYEPNGTWKDIPTSIERKKDCLPNEVIVNFPIELNGKIYTLAIPSTYNNGVLTIEHKESDIITSDVGNFKIGFYQWTEGHTTQKYVEQITANWNGVGFSFNPDDCVIVKSPDTGQPILEADFLILTKVKETNYKCSEVSFEYDGRYLKIEGNGLWDEIYYTMDADTYPVNGILFKNPFDIGGINSTVRAVAVKDGYEPSEIATFTPDAYGIEGEAWVKGRHTLQDAYNWLSKEQSHQGWPTLTVHGSLIPDSYQFIEYLSALRYLDLSDCVSDSIPAIALKSTGLISVSLPKELKFIGKNVFFNNRNLSALIWNTKSDVSPEMASALNESLDGQGVLFYIDGFDYLNDTNSLHVIKDGVANKPIVLKETNSWYCPREFKATSISFTKEFSRKTSIDGCSGWETIALPFDVNSISYGSESLFPFGNVNGDELSKRFWVYRADTGWKLETDIHAYTPYLIAMPNNEAYYEPYNIVGNVTFASTDITISSTPEKKGWNLAEDLTFYPNFLNEVKENGMRLVNNGYYEGCEPGSVFVMDDRNAQPYEAYVLGPGTRKIAIMDHDLSKVDYFDLSIKVWSEGKSICMTAPFKTEITVYDLSGRCVARQTVVPSSVNRIEGLADGIYIVANKKVLVK